MTVIIVTLAIVTVVIVTVIIGTIIILTVVIVTVVKVVIVTTDAMFEGQRFAILAMFLLIASLSPIMATDY